MGGELLGGMLRSSVYLSGGSVLVPRQMGLEFVVLELRPLPASRTEPVRITPRGTRVQTGERGGPEQEARLSVPCVIPQALGPLGIALGARYRHVKTQIQNAFPCSRSHVI